MCAIFHPHPAVCPSILPTLSLSKSLPFLIPPYPPSSIPSSILPRSLLSTNPPSNPPSLSPPFSLSIPSSIAAYFRPFVPGVPRFLHSFLIPFFLNSPAFSFLSFLPPHFFRSLQPSLPPSIHQPVSVSIKQTLVIPMKATPSVNNSLKQRKTLSNYSLETVAELSHSTKTSLKSVGDVLVVTCSEH